MSTLQSISSSKVPPEFPDILKDPSGDWSLPRVTSRVNRIQGIDASEWLVLKIVPACRNSEATWPFTWPQFSRRISNHDLFLSLPTWVMQWSMVNCWFFGWFTLPGSCQNFCHEDFTREVLRSQPENINEFAAKWALSVEKALSVKGVKGVRSGEWKSLALLGG